MGAFRFKNQQTASRMDVLPPEQAAKVRNQAGLVRKLDIVDVEFEVVPLGTQRSSSVLFNDNAKSASTSQGLSTRRVIGRIVRGVVRAVSSIENTLQSTSPKVFAGLVTVAFACVFLGAAAFAGIVPLAPSSGEPAGLHVAGISTSLDARDGMQVLSVYGRVVNATGQRQTMPRILVDVMVGEKRISTSSLTPQASSIASGQTSYFSARLPHSGGKKPEVRVSLAPVGAPGN